VYGFPFPNEDRFGGVRVRRSVSFPDDSALAPLEQEVRYQSEEGTLFSVRGGCEVVIHARAVHRRDVLPSWEGLPREVVILLLRQRGFLVLHAGAVAIEGGGVAFIGPSHAGKSTLSAAFQARGHTALADDMLLIRPDAEGGPSIVANTEAFHLWPDSARFFHDHPDTLQRVFPGHEKRILPANPNGGNRTDYPLRRIYALSEGETVRKEPLPLREALNTLLGNTCFVTPFPKDPILSQCARVVRHASPERLIRPMRYDCLEATAEFIEAEALSMR